MSTFEYIIVESKGAVGIITLNRPKMLNALSFGVFREIAAAVDDLEADDAIGCILLTGGEKAFAAGADIKEMSNRGFSEMFGENYFGGFDRVTATRKPWIAAVAGFALGGGCELAMMADFIIAAETAKFGQPEVKLGVAPGMGGSQRLARAAGKAKAMDMCLSGRMMDVHEAERAGLVSRITSATTLVEDAIQAAAEIAALPPLATIANKEMVNTAFEVGLSAGLLFERRLFNGLCATADKREGMAAFVEKRKGSWTGK